MSELLGNYLGAAHGVLMALALVVAIAARHRICKRHLGWLAAATAIALVAFSGLLIASFRMGEFAGRLTHALLLPLLAAATTGCGALVGFSLVLRVFGLARSDAP